MVAVTSLKSFWAQLVLLPDIAMGDLERLRELTLALLFVHGGLEQAAAKRRVLQTLVEEGFAVRAKLTTLVTLLVDAGKVPASVIEQLKGGTAYTAVANDIRSLVEALRLRWSEIGDSAFINKAQIDAAQLLSDRIYSNVLTEAGAGASADEFGTSDMRRRGFTLAKRLYVDIRRAAKYMLGRTHDVDALIAPLATTRPKRRVPPVVASDVAGDTGEPGSETEPVVEVGATRVATDSAETPTREMGGGQIVTSDGATLRPTPRRRRPARLRKPRLRPTHARRRSPRRWLTSPSPPRASRRRPTRRVDLVVLGSSGGPLDTFRPATTLVSSGSGTNRGLPRATCQPVTFALRTPDCSPIRLAPAG